MSKQNDLNIKNYLEKHLEFETLSCVHSKQSILYRMRNSEGIEMTYEVLGNGALKFTIESETRKIPAPEELAQTLKHFPSDIELVRLASQVVEKMLDNHRDPLHVEFRNKFDRHANKH